MREDFRALQEEVHGFRRDLMRISEKPKVEVFIKVEKGGVVNTGSHIGGDNYGPVAVNSVQVIGSIQQNIGVLQQKPETKPAADAIAALTNAIKDSLDFPSERERKRLLEDIEELTVQASRPQGAHEKGVVGPIIDRLAGVCGAAGGLATVWQVAGPAIRTFFGF